MKKFLLVILIGLTSLVSYGQFPIVEEFDIGTPWMFTNGAGIQNYGGVENYATFNIGNTPYPNSSTIDITSPIYDFSSSCSSDITVIFEISGIIENTWDNAYFQYNNGGWVTVGPFTGSLTGTYTNTIIPNTTTQFRFRLITDGSVNTYGNGANTNVYYYDFRYFIIDCVVPLPVEFIDMYLKCDRVEWVTVTEVNNDYFTLYHSLDTYNWTQVHTQSGGGNLNTPAMYTYRTEGLPRGYYKLTQTDFDGKTTDLEIDYIDCGTYDHGSLEEVWSIDGRYLGTEYPKKSGVYIIKYKGQPRILRGILNKN